MNAEIKTQWLEALRSGQYAQGQEYLHIKRGGVDTYCCLGVLSDLAVKAGVAKVTLETPMKEYDTVLRNFVVVPDASRVYYGTADGEDVGCEQLPPENVWQWAGLEYDDPRVIRDEGDDSIALSTLNDRGVSFEEIAQLIEEQL